MRTNRPTTHEGAPATPLTPYGALRRSVMSCLLFEKEFYEDGKEIAGRIVELAEQVDVWSLAKLAIEARNVQQLRHAPLLLLAVLARRARGVRLHDLGPGIVADTIASTISRADELGEFLAIYAQQNGVDGWHLKPKLSAQVKKGLARALANFDEYQLSKWDRDRKKVQVTLTDVLRLSHPVPGDRAGLYRRLLKGELADPMTWERQLSAGGDRKAVWTQLLRDQKLGYLALLRNLRNMIQAGVDSQDIEEAILARRGSWRVLPFRFVAAAEAAPQFEDVLGTALQAQLKLSPFTLPGTTGVLVDVSGSMDAPLSQRSEMTRMKAGAALAAIVPAQKRRIWTFTDRVAEVVELDRSKSNPIALVKVICNSQPYGGTYLGAAVADMNTRDLDRLIVITDEQSHDVVPEPKARRAYMINVASARNGVGYGEGWIHIDGWSDNVLRFIAMVEGEVKALPLPEEVE
jgi:hypothetical protein